MNKGISIVIPLYNEAEGIETLILALNAFFAFHNKVPIEIIFVNDGSSDNSFSILQRQQFENYKAKLISFSRNFGSHAALRAGILHAEMEYITFMYADLQDPLELVIQLYNKQQEGADIVWAYRANTQNSSFERMFSLLYARLMQMFAFPDFPEKGFDIVLFNSKIKQQLDKNIESNSNIFLQILGMGFSQRFIQYNKTNRNIGKSKWTISKKIKMLIDSFVAFSYAPIRFVSLMGMLFFSFGIFWTIYIASRKLLYNDLTSGWPALTSILLLGFGITNIGLGIIAEYLWRTLDASRKRPVFIIDQIIDLNSSEE
jgi:glycosyltransferase involved in cell wall biosynthesis